MSDADRKNQLGIGKKQHSERDGGTVLTTFWTGHQPSWPESELSLEREPSPKIEIVCPAGSDRGFALRAGHYQHRAACATQYLLGQIHREPGGTDYDQVKAERTGESHNLFGNISQCREMPDAELRIRLFHQFGARRQRLKVEQDQVRIVASGQGAGRLQGRSGCNRKIAGM
jgi:hypothetical protein